MCYIISGKMTATEVAAVLEKDSEPKDNPIVSSRGLKRTRRIPSRFN